MTEIDRLKEVVKRLRGVDGCKFDYILQVSIYGQTAVLYGKETSL